MAMEGFVGRKAPGPPGAEDAVANGNATAGCVIESTDYVALSRPMTKTRHRLANDNDAPSYLTEGRFKCEIFC